MKAYKVLVKKPGGSLHSARLAWGLEGSYTLLYVEGHPTVPEKGVSFAFDNTRDAEMFGRRVKKVKRQKALPYSVEIWECKVTKSKNQYGMVSSFLAAFYIDGFWDAASSGMSMSPPPPGTICCSMIHPIRKLL